MIHQCHRCGGLYDDGSGPPQGIAGQVCHCARQHSVTEADVRRIIKEELAADQRHKEAVGYPLIKRFAE